LSLDAPGAADMDPLPVSEDRLANGITSASYRCKIEPALAVVSEVASSNRLRSRLDLGASRWSERVRKIENESEHTDLQMAHPATDLRRGCAAHVFGGRRRSGRVADMKPLRDRSMRQRITLVIELTSCAVLLLACTALFAFQVWSIRENFVNQLTVMGEIVANNVAEAAMSRDASRATQTIGGLRVMPEIVSASLHLSDGTRLAHWGADDAEDIRNASSRDGFSVHGTRVLLVQPVVRDGQRQGALELQADFYSLSVDLLRLYGGILALVLAASLLLALFLSGRFQHFVSAPILRLADIAHRIANDRDYTMRAEKTGDDEVGALTEAFYQMLGQIQSQNTALRESEERFRSVAESAADAIIIADGQERVLSWNKGARMMFGYEAEEMQGQPLSAIVAQSYCTQFFAGMSRLRENGAEKTTGPAMELFGLRKDGMEFPIEMAMSNWTTGSGTFVSGVIRDVSERKTAEVTLRDSQQRLLETSRLAGMAEVATGVLHNVGNVLNSVNVSAGLVVEKLRRSKVPNLGKAAALLAERNGDLGNFLTNDPNGQKIPGYLAKLSQFLIAENSELLTEVDLLARNIEHIKEVVAVQQSYAKVSGVFEDLAADQLVEDSIAMNIGAFERHGIVLERRFSPAPPVSVDRHRVLQILINLLRNAKYALDDVQRIDKRITITIAPADDKMLRIAVADNGIGISQENLDRIFGHGFTTRKNGHGFGLHSGALAAKEMGGSLSVQSLGLRRGATFMLELPIAAKPQL
jgi:PAS domain S-box-containing protein